MLKPFPRSGGPVEREEGYLPLEAYAALGEGRSVALSGADGSIDWWCCPNLDSPPLFDRLLSPHEGGYFSVTPDEPFTTEIGYREGSNVHETVFTTATGKARLTESLNSGPAGRLPWAELARRIEGLEGRVRLRITLVFGTRGDTAGPFLSANASGKAFHVAGLMGLFRYSDGIRIEAEDDHAIAAVVEVTAGRTETIAIVAGEDEPLVVAPVAHIDRRIEVSCKAWRDWTEGLGYGGRYRGQVERSALALKLLLYSPTGAIAAAATTSLPEGIGGRKNYDYRYAWVRDAGYVIKAFLRLGAHAESSAALAWLVRHLDEHGAQVLYTLNGETVSDEEELDLPGYRNSRPVRRGNAATGQHQHGIYGDIFETAERFVVGGGMLDLRTGALLARLADECAEKWKMKDAGIWELPERRHYTGSKISCWQALARAVEMAENGHLPGSCKDRWSRARDRVAAWIEEHCWSENKQAYVMYPGSDMLDASLTLAVRFRYGNPERLRATCEAIDRELGRGPYHYRYTGVEAEEGCFLACTFWLAEAMALLGQADAGAEKFEAVVWALDRNSGTCSEMADPVTGAFLGNLPQGLTHLALIQAAATLSGMEL
ncbi:Glucoamylase (glucan-1,4-alpha-glucosidase), GH15 family [Methylobacterium sp. ap11]|uniref:glycoside hydrolase family 15 protein n=1 Tax=Methylobacterium sp. ap11 TaxID=1761799 RepID=UPI0008CFF9D0|nr:glycoside hydrolase family 15 protein [Methylobacterium sp. ap11]SEP51319.1 Glucoamylase (glucan-1,4-alpha-glucosidase), GH15 family [Methylobacterium sp. ap11]